MKIFLVALLSASLFGSVLLFYPRPTVAPAIEEPVALAPAPSDPQTILEETVRVYLQSKNSPLAEEVEILVSQKHWKLLIAISAIESQYCKRQLGKNCWGIKVGGNTYRQYDSYAEAIVDANNLIEKWQARGKWLTPENMIGSYVVPGSANWLYTVKSVLAELDALLIKNT